MNTLREILKFCRGLPIFPSIILLVFVVTALFAPWLAPYSPKAGSLPNQLLPPGKVGVGGKLHLLGTDKFGRDVFSRIIYGTRISVIVAALCIFFAGSIGTLVGLVAGYFGGWLDHLLMRIVDIALSLPAILMAIILAATIGQSFGGVIAVVAFLLWPRYARQIRGEALAIRGKEFIDLARVAGQSNPAIILRHVFPNVVPTLLVLATWQVGYVILLESSLSFLGVGIPPPTPAWGLMVADGRNLVATAWWISTFPGLAILLVTLSINLLGDWLRDRLDPKLATV